jgi:hypothetical protein
MPLNRVKICTLEIEDDEFQAAELGQQLIHEVAHLN